MRQTQSGASAADSAPVSAEKGGRKEAAGEEEEEGGGFDVPESIEELVGLLLQA